MKLQKILIINSDIKYDFNEKMKFINIMIMTIMEEFFLLKKYLLKPKLFIWKIKNSIISFFKSRSFLNNFFG